MESIKDIAKDIGAAILAGGRASRLKGMVKGLIKLPGGMTVIERLVNEVQKTGIDDVILCANDGTPYASLGLDTVPDRLPGKGPLGGIDAALGHYAGQKKAVLFLPCDLPAVTSKEISSLLESCADTPKSIVYAHTADGIEHPLCAVVAVDECDAVRTALEDKKLSVRRLWQELDGKQVEFADSAAFVNVNTSEDLERYVLKTGRTPSSASADVGRVSHPTSAVSDAGNDIPPDNT
jgi:molybdopterin-guanine dinucleotide biosynthesis protein A